MHPPPATDRLPSRPGPPRTGALDTGRTIASAALVVLGVLGIVVGAYGWWSQRTLLDSEFVEDAVHEALGDPVLADGLAEFVTDEVLPRARIVETLVIATQLGDGDDAPEVREQVDESRVEVEGVVRGLVAQEPTRTDLARRVADVHAAVVALLRDEPPPPSPYVRVVTIDGREVVEVDFLIILERGLGALDDLARLAGIELPDPERPGEHSQRVSELGTAVGIEISDDFAIVAVFDRDVVSPSRRAELAELAVRIADLRWWFLAAGVAAAAGSIALAPRRGLPLIVLGSLLVPSAIGAWLVGRRAIDRAARFPNRDTIRQVLLDAGSPVTDSLTRFSLFLGALGFAIAVVGVVVDARDRRRSETAAWEPSTYHR